MLAQTQCFDTRAGERFEMQLDTIFAAVADPEETIQPAIQSAADLARTVGAQVVLFHATFDSSLSGRPFFDSRRLARSRGWLVAKRTREIERHARKLQQRGLDARTHVVWEEPAYESIIRGAIREKADLVVAGTHMPGRPNAPFSLRQNDWQLLRLCPRPLLLVRGSQPARGPVLAALDPTHANDKPATLDRALARAASYFAEAMGTDFHAVHSIPAAVYPLDASDAASRAQMRKKVRKKMERLLARSKTTVARAHILQGAPEKTIPRLVAKLDAQLLVMGALSRRGLKRFAIGDTAERTIGSLSCDLLILKPENFELKLGRTKRESVILPEE